MKTKEFVKKVEELGFIVDIAPNFLEVISKDFNTILQVCYKFRGRLDTDWNGFTKLNDWNIQSKLLSLAVEYAKTPIEEREEPEKYYLRLPNFMHKSESYLNYNTRNKTYCFYDGCELGELQTKFTQEEIDSMPNQDFIKTLIKEDVNE